ncbi:MAG: hypothetical protein DHS20C05_24720 [Hyphococcus sp.]|nr:MAG: hypothetical protein DHS20C05_24720 [Marinicaulis sp.]
MFGWLFNRFGGTPKKEPKLDIRYSHPGVEEFNKRLHERQNPPPKSRIDEPWSPAKKGPLPNVQRDFAMTDPYIRLQMADAEKSEQQRREEQTGRGSRMVSEDHPFMAHRPAPHERGDVDRERFAADWLIEMRDALIAMSPPDKLPRDPGFDHKYQPQQPRY